MTDPTTGIARTERYAYQSLHWGLPMAPVLVAFYALVTQRDDRTLWLVLAAVAASAVAAWAGLVVVHTGLREAGDLTPGAWDRWFHAPHRKRRWVVIWGATAVLACGLASFLIPVGVQPGRLIDALVFALLAAVLSFPVFGLTRRRAPVYGAGIVLVMICVVASPDPDTLIPRIAMAFPACLWAGLLIALASMMLNVLRTTQELDRARRSSARLAVAEERLRFARDLHDVLGRTLSAVALKAELAAAQADQRRPEAVATTREVQTIAHDALGELRGLVRGYRETDLAGELAGARSLLESAGIAVSTLVETGPLPPSVARCLAWVVREGTTNVLRHAAATTVRISLVQDASGVGLTVANDGAETVQPASGSGLAGLSERLDEVGGRLGWSVRDGWWMLTAQVDAATLERLDTAGSQS